jgi:mannose-1-phosphate guanylyltransferase
MNAQSHQNCLELDQPAGSRHRWGVILAGGDGKRLLPLTRRITGDDRPKQFCAVIGRETLLDQTRDRVRQIVRPEHIMVVLTKPHERFYGDLASDAECSQVLVQPFNRGTAPAIVYSLMRLSELDPDGVVAMFPSDHHFADEVALKADLDVAFDAAEHRPDRIVLLGITPDYPEAEYGWVEPGVPLGGCLPDSVCQVARFWEKPSHSLASALMDNGCLWNSFVMVGKIAAFLALIHRALPQLMGAFESIRPTLFTVRETAAVREVYSGIRPTSFSDEVLSIYSDDLAVVCSRNIGWSDLGETSRVLSVLESKRLKPEWAREYAQESAAAR